MVTTRRSTAAAAAAAGGGTTTTTTTTTPPSTAGDGAAAPAPKGAGGSSSSSSSSRVKVFLYYPNLIGYARILFMLASFWYGVRGGVGGSWAVSVGCYFLGFFGDVVDGHVARAFNQSSEFGAVLDMVTDRTSTAGLVMLNLYWTSREEPLWALFWIVLVVIDIGSHWFHCISTAKSGHHKSADTLKGRAWLLRMYYGVFPFFAFCCVGQELFYLINYISYFEPDLLPVVSLGGALTSILSNHQQLHDFVLLLGFTRQAGSEVLTIQPLHVLWGISLVACLIKQVVNLAQLLSAAGALADTEEEANKKKKSSKTTK